MEEAAKNIEDTPTKEEKARLVGIANDLDKQLKGIYHAEKWVSYESSISVHKLCVKLNVQIGDKECEDDRGVYTRPEFEADIMIKKSGIKIEEYESTPNGTDHHRTYDVNEVSAKAVVDYLEGFDLPKKESYDQAWLASRTVQPRENRKDE